MYLTRYISPKVIDNTKSHTYHIKKVKKSNEGEDEGKLNTLSAKRVTRCGAL